jgi:nucleoid-associated protein YgaU
MTLTKATITVLDKAAVDPARGLPERFEVQFNPTEYTLAKSAVLAEVAIPGLDNPVLQFVRGQNERLTLELLYDTSDGGMAEGAQDVRDLTAPIHQLVKVQPRTHAIPRIELTWGRGRPFRAVAESVQQRFTLFSPDGVPLRAVVSLTLREYETLQEQLSRLNLQSADHTKVHTVRAGETLAGIAAAEYGDARVWRLIADRNRVADPRRPVPGTRLELPPNPPGPGTP